MLGDFRKYPYYTMGGILEFQGKGDFLDWNSEGMGGYAVWNFKCIGRFSSEFPESEDGESFV